MLPAMSIFGKENTDYFSPCLEFGWIFLGISGQLQQPCVRCDDVGKVTATAQMNFGG